jgi:predicted acylesterase/phospholipase RssA
MTTKALVLSGGGAKCVGHCAAAEALGVQHDVFKILAGASSGGIVAMLLSIGMHPRTCMRYMASHLAQLEPSYWDMAWGVLGRGERRFRDLYEPLCDTVTKHIIRDRPPTFAEVREQYCRDLVIVATSVNREEVVTFSASRTPNMDIVRAACMSAMLPGFFHPEPWDGHLLADGGVMANVPVVECESAAEEAGYRGIETTAVTVTCSEPPCMISGSFLPTLGTQLINCAITATDRLNVRMADRHIALDTTPIDTQSFVCDAEVWESVYDKCRDQVHECLE